MSFKVSAKELVELRSEQSMHLLKSYGGVSGVVEKLKSHLQKGLNSKDVKDPSREAEFGTNLFPDPPFKSFLGLLWDALQDTTLIILIVSAVISLILGITVRDPDKDKDGYEDKNTGWIEGAAILLAVAIVSLVTAINDYSKEKQFRELNKVKENRPVKVMRDGKMVQSTTYDLVVGDVVCLDTGDSVPADGLFVEGHGVVVDQSAMTGESEGVNKNAEAPFMISGCQISEGMGKMVVTCVGENSEWGETLAGLSEEQDPTPLQSKLEDLAELIGWFGVGAAVLTFTCLTGHWAWTLYTSEEEFAWSMCSVLVDFLIIAITIVVVAVPEGLPLAVTISLAYSMQKMMNDNNLVRKLEACETMGGATDICSDKTGTLTENRMTVTDGWFAGSVYERMDDKPPKIADPTRSLLVESISVNSNAFVNVGGDRPEFIGNKTECALLYMIHQLFDAEFQRIRSGAKVVALEAFSSEKKCMSCVVTTGFLPSDDKKVGHRLYTKGASEILLGKCTKTLDKEGKECKLETPKKNELEEYIHGLASRGLRTLALCYRHFPEGDSSWSTTDRSLVVEDLVLLAIVGIKDPIRPEVPAAVSACRDAGIKVRMVTGDNKTTAEFIAKEAGILSPGGLVMEGPAFRRLSEKEQDEIIPDLCVLARSSPRDKYVLVDRLKKMGRVVAVTGDGTNDAAALKKADVGLSMGLAGTEVAKEASDIVLLDDNFASIVKAVMWGRCVYENIRKFLQFQLTVNVVALTTSFTSALAEFGTPLTAVQLLWVNLIMDTMAALALATEAPTPELLKRAPYGRHDKLINKRMWKHIFLQSAFQLVVQYVILVLAPTWMEVIPKSRLHYTISFNAFVFCQVFNEINCRKINDEGGVFEGIFGNTIYVGVIVSTFLIQYAFVTFGDDFTQCVPLTTDQWIWTLGVASLSLPLGFIFRAIPVPDEAAKTKKE